MTDTNTSNATDTASHISRPKAVGSHARTNSGRLVLTDRMDRLTVPRCPRTGMLPPAHVVGSYYGVLLWDAGDHVEMLAPASCPTWCDDPERDFGLIRTAAAAIGSLAPHTIELRLDCLWGTTGVAGHLGAVIGLTCTQVIVNGASLDLTEPHGLETWSRFRTIMRYAAPHPGPPHDEPQAAAIPLSAA